MIIIIGIDIEVAHVFVTFIIIVTIIIVTIMIIIIMNIIIIIITDFMSTFLLEAHTSWPQHLMSTAPPRADWCQAVHSVGRTKGLFLL